MPLPNCGGKGGKNVCRDVIHDDDADSDHLDSDLYHVCQDRMVGNSPSVDRSAFFGGGAAFYIFLMRQFSKGIPKELTESAIIDGANHWQIFVKIMLPLSKPAVVTVALFTFMGSWNDYFGPLIFLSNPDHWTLAIGLRAFQTQYGGQYNLMMAASILIMLPTLLLFFFAQRTFIEGIKFTGFKGLG
jgi:multiple sugar transport system permease protein